MFGLFKSHPKALVIVDVQNDFVPGGALPVPHGDQIVPVINKLQKDFELVVATKDWHPEGHCSFASAHPGHAVGERIGLDIGSQLLWPDHCVQGSSGAEFVAGLETGKIQKIFEKGVDPQIDSYSGMYDNGNLRETGLRAYLKENKVTDVYIVGLATEFTVKFTALDCKREGFNVHVVKDGCRGLEQKPGDTEKALNDMKHVGVHIK